MAFYTFVLVIFFFKRREYMFRKIIHAFILVETKYKPSWDSEKDPNICYKSLKVLVKQSIILIKQNSHQTG